MTFQFESYIKAPVNNEGETELHVVVRSNILSRAKDLIKTGVDVDAKCYLLETPLHKAVQQDQKDMVKILLENGASINEKNMYNETPLHKAVRNGNLDIVYILMKNNARIDLKDIHDHTPLYLAGKLDSKDIFKLLTMRYAYLYQINISETIIHIAVRKCEQNLLQTFIENNLDIDRKDYFGRTPLHFAICGRNLTIIKILVENGANIHEKDKEGKSPLCYAAKLKLTKVSNLLIKYEIGKNKTSDTAMFHEAVSNDDAEMLELFINEETDLNQEYFCGLSLLHFAVARNLENIALFLLKHGADPNILDNEKLTFRFVFDLSFETVNVSKKQTPLHLALHHDGKIPKNHENLVHMLLNYGADPNALNYKNQSPLFLALQSLKGNARIVQLLLENGADPNIEDFDGKSPLISSIMKNYYETTKLLIQYGANINENENGPWFHIPIHCAIKYGCKKVLMLLIQNGANLDYKSSYGTTVLHAAIEERKMEMSTILVENSANVNVISDNWLTPLHYGVIMNCVDIVILLLQHGASLSLDVKGGHVVKLTPIEYSMRDRKLEVMKAIFSFTTISK